MPRSPLVTSAVRDLAEYFKATTDASFIDKSWDIKVISSNPDLREDTVSKDPKTKIAAYGKISREVEYTTGTPVADHISNLINGSVGVGNFLNVVKYPLPKSPKDYNEQLKIYKMIDRSSESSKVLFKEIKTAGDLSINPTRDFKEDAASGTDQHPNVNLYAGVVMNPFIGPMTKDTGPLEVFMNGMPTLELSRCVPYLSVEVISLLRTAGTVAPPLTLVGFLNPSRLGSSDAAILNAQTTIVKTEASTLGTGLRSGMELFTAPQTLVNLGDTGPEFVPVIDRMRPLASLGNLSLSTKIQGGTLSFTTGRLEITVHDRSRLREVAAFVRPDLYGTTFLDITHGWSHPEGGISSKNKFGKFLDALKNTTRFRIAGSTYTFEEGGQMKITLNIQTVGSTDLLYLGPKEVTPAMREMQKIIRSLNDILADLRARNVAPSMVDFDILSAFQDPSSALAASSNKDLIQKIRKLIEKLGDSSKIAELLKNLVGAKLNEKSEAVGADGQIAKAQDSLQESYEKILNQIPTYSEDEGGFGILPAEKIKLMTDNTFVYTDPGSNQPKATNDVSKFEGSGVIDRGNSSNKKIVQLTGDDFISYGSAFMNLIAKPIKESGQYDEVQVIFYPFNKYAGIVHDLPISAFPIERERFKKAIDKLAGNSPNVSCRQIIGLMYDRFTHFPPARAYLMAGFYNQSKAQDGTIEQYDPKGTYKINYTEGGKSKQKTVAPNTQLTFEERLKNAGIPERRFIMPQVQVSVEGCPLTDERGEVLKDGRGNPKTLIKIHVFDAAMDPHSSLSDLVRSARDNELGVIVAPLATLNSNIRAGGNAGVKAVNSSYLEAAGAALEAGRAAGLLERVNVDTLKTIDPSAKSMIDDMSTNNVFYRVRGDYNGIKRLVTAAIPTITYGSSTSAIIGASLSSNTSPGLGNVQLLRAFTEPGEVRAESLDTGVPMLVVPSQLSISTFGCPLFSPMQRLFIDFGTGTSIDNLYNVISIDSTIGVDGFKTEVKLGFADGFAQYRSLNQNLALLALNLSGDELGGTTTNPLANAGSSQLPFAAQPIRAPEDVVDDARRLGRQLLIDVIQPLAQLEANVNAEIQEKLAEAQAKLMAKIETEKQKAIARVEAAIPEPTKIKVRKAQQDLAIVAAEAKEKAEPVVRAALLAQQYAQVLALIETLPGSVGAIVLSEALAALDEARALAAENARNRR